MITFFITFIALDFDSTDETWKQMLSNKPRLQLGKKIQNDKKRREFLFIKSYAQFEIYVQILS